MLHFTALVIVTTPVVQNILYFHFSQFFVYGSYYKERIYPVQSYVCLNRDIPNFASQRLHPF